MTYPTGWPYGYNPNLGDFPEDVGWSKYDSESYLPGKTDVNLIGSPPDASLEVVIDAPNTGDMFLAPSLVGYSYPIGTGTGLADALLPEQFAFGLTMPANGCVGLLQRVRGRGYNSTFIFPDRILWFQGTSHTYMVDCTGYHDYRIVFFATGHGTGWEIYVDGVLIDANTGSSTFSGSPSDVGFQFQSGTNPGTEEDPTFSYTEIGCTYLLDYAVWAPYDFIPPSTRGPWTVGRVRWPLTPSTAITASVSYNQDAATTSFAGSIANPAANLDDYLWTSLATVGSATFLGSPEEDVTWWASNNLTASSRRVRQWERIPPGATLDSDDDINFAWDAPGVAAYSVVVALHAAGLTRIAQSFATPAASTYDLPSPFTVDRAALIYVWSDAGTTITADLATTRIFRSTDTVDGDLGAIGTIEVYLAQGVPSGTTTLDFELTALSGSIQIVTWHNFG